jgi:hypothetical protein
MTIDRDKLTTFFYLLTRGQDERAGMGWGTVEDVILDCLPYESAKVCVNNGAAALAREMVDRLLGPEPAEAEPVLDPGWLPYTEHERWLAANRGHIDQLREVIRLAINEHGGVPARIADAVIAAGWTRAPVNADRERRETLLAAAKMLRDLCGQRSQTVDELIDRCNLAAIADGGVVRSEPDEPGEHAWAVEWTSGDSERVSVYWSHSRASDAADELRGLLRPANASDLAELKRAGREHAPFVQLVRSEP